MVDITGKSINHFFFYLQLEELILEKDTLDYIDLALLCIPMCLMQMASLTFYVVGYFVEISTSIFPTQYCF